MTDYTPSIARIEDMYSWAVAWKADPPSERPDLAVLQENQRAEFRRALAAHDAEVAAKALKSVIDKVDLEAIADEWSDGGEDSNRHWAAGNAASTVLNLLYDARNAEIRKAAEQ